MKSYIVTKQFAGLKEGEIFNGSASPFYFQSYVGGTLRDILLALGFIEETGKIAQEVGGENEITYLMPDGSPLFSHLNKFCKHFSPYLHPAPQNEWRPKVNERYWYVDDESFEPGRTTNDTDSDRLRVALGNAFKTESAALRAAEEIRNLLKTLPKE